MEVSGQFHAPATLPPGKEPPVTIGYEAGWAPEPVWTLWRREKSLSLLETEPQFLGRPTSSVVTASTHPLRFHVSI
jgi:hypothetical protein